MTIKTLASKLNLVERRRQAAYDKMIAESQAKLAETVLVPGHTNIYA